MVIKEVSSNIEDRESEDYNRNKGRDKDKDKDKNKDSRLYIQVSSKFKELSDNKGI